MGINQRVGFRQMGGCYSAYNCDTQELLVLNESGSQVFEAIVQGDSPAERLMRVYSIPAEQAEEDTAEFLEMLASGGFLESTATPAEVESESGDGYDALLDLELRAIEELVPFAATFEVTYACNEKCVHCYMDKGKTILSFAEVCRMLDELADAGCMFVSFTGGEFFCRKDALRILEYASSKRFVIDVLSNGTLITPDMVQKLTELSVRRVQLSLYAARAELHDEITRVSGSFEKTIEALRALRAAEIKVEVAFPMMSLNFHERYEVWELANQHDCAFSPSPYITARNDGSQDTFDLRISDEQLREFLADEILASSYAGRRPFEEHQFYFGIEDLCEAPPCYSGFNSAAISPEGKLYPCNQFLHPLGDLRINNFSEIWNSDEATWLRGIRIGDLPTCHSCGLLSGCTRCPGLALLETGSMYGPSPENCRVARANKALGKEV